MDAYRIWMPLQARQVFFLERETVSRLCKMHRGGCWNAYLHSIIPFLASRYSHIFRFDDSDVDWWFHSKTDFLWKYKSQTVCYWISVWNRSCWNHCRYDYILFFQWCWVRKSIKKSALKKYKKIIFLYHFKFFQHIECVTKNEIESAASFTVA